MIFNRNIIPINDGARGVGDIECCGIGVGIIDQTVDDLGTAGIGIGYRAEKQAQQLYTGDRCIQFFPHTAPPMALYLRELSINCLNVD